MSAALVAADAAASVLCALSLLAVSGAAIYRFGMTLSP
jgi:hypothetical protein